jgi:hypothetical protein
MDASDVKWERMMAKRNEPKVDPAKDLGEFTAKSDAQGKEANVAMRKKGIDGKIIVFTDPVKSEAGMPPILKGQIPKHRDEANADSEVIDYDWKIVASGDARNPAWTVGEGKVYYLNDATEATVLSTSVEGEAGGIYLHITRNPASRAVTAQTVELYVETPFTGESDQYFLLGNVGGSPVIIQRQFTPIRVYEDLFIINGEFKLGSIAMLADNLYTPPA